ncbi:MAG: hypothetical protein AAGL17_00030 [Cyanobacteria bacterium J06576_12]
MSVKTYTVRVSFSGVELDDDDRDVEASKLLRQMRDLDGVESAKRLVDENPPANNKSVGGFIVGALTAEINTESASKVFSFFKERLSGKPIEMEVEANGKKLRVKANSSKELLAAVEAAERFVSA